MQAGRVAAVSAANRRNRANSGGAGRSSASSSSSDVTSSLSSMLGSFKKTATKTASAASSLANKSVGVAKEKLGISKSSSDTSARQRLQPSSSEIRETDPEDLQQLLAMGFPRDDSMWALQQTGPGKLEQAVLLLTSAPELEEQERPQMGQPVDSAAVSSLYSPGAWVECHSLRSQSGRALNGKVGQVLSYDASLQRFIVDFAGVPKMLRPANLKKASMTNSMTTSVKSSIKGAKGSMKDMLKWSKSSDSGEDQGLLRSAESSEQLGPEVAAQRRADALAAAEKRQKPNAGNMDDWRRQQRQLEAEQIAAMQQRRAQQQQQQASQPRAPKVAMRKAPTSAQIEAAPVLNVEARSVIALMTAQLIDDPGNPTKTEILPLVDLGRSGDTANEGYDLVVCATSAETNLNAPLQALNILQLPIVDSAADDEAAAGLFLKALGDNDQKIVQDTLLRIDATRQAGKRVLVCCQDGRERSALVVLAYIMSKYSVSSQAALNYVQSLRPIVSILPMCMDFLNSAFVPPSLAPPDESQAGENGVEPDEGDADRNEGDDLEDLQLQQALEMSMGLGEEQLVAPSASAQEPTVEESAAAAAMEDSSTALAAMQQSSLDHDAEVMDVPAENRELLHAQLQQAMMEEEMELQRALALSVETERGFLDQERVDMACAVAASKPAEAVESHPQSPEQGGELPEDPIEQFDDDPVSASLPAETRVQEASSPAATASEMVNDFAPPPRVATGEAKLATAETAVPEQPPIDAESTTEVKLAAVEVDVITAESVEISAAADDAKAESAEADVEIVEAPVEAAPVIAPEPAQRVAQQLPSGAVWKDGKITFPSQLPVLEKPTAVPQQDCKETVQTPASSAAEAVIEEVLDEVAAQSHAIDAAVHEGTTASAASEDATVQDAEAKVEHGAAASAQQNLEDVTIGQAPAVPQTAGVEAHVVPQTVGEVVETKEPVPAADDDEGF